MDQFKIECMGDFKVRRGELLVGCVQEEARGEPDLVLISEEADIIPTHKNVLCLYSSSLSAVLSTVQCCQNMAVSVPFSTRTISSLLKLITFGCSNALDRKGLASLTECAQVLGISVQGLEIIEQKKVVTLEVGQGTELKSLLARNQDGVDYAAHDRIAVQFGATELMAPKRKSKKIKKDQRAPRISDDDIIEITPEMYANNVDHDDIAIMPQHFLMQGGDDSYQEEPTFNDSENWDERGAWGSDMALGHASDFAAPEVREVASEEDPEVKVYSCSFCPGQIFKKKNDINRHLKKHVPIEMRKRFQCEMCKEKFINNSNLKVHMKVCTGKVKEFPCKKCGEVQHNKTDHLEHLARVHNINKKHGCPICHKQLKKTSDLKKHMATHSNQKPFTCEVCGKKFKTESYVKVHMKAHFANGHVPTARADLEDGVGHADEPETPEAADANDSNGGLMIDETERYSEPDVHTSEGVQEHDPEDLEGEDGLHTDPPEVTMEEGDVEGADKEEEHAEEHAENMFENAQAGKEEDDIHSGLDTPSGVGTPGTPSGEGEGGSTSDEMDIPDHQRLEYGNKDLYVAQMNVFRNSTEIA